MLAPEKMPVLKFRQHIKKQRHYFANKGLSSQSYGFSSSHVWMWELNHKEGWAPKNWCFWTAVLEKTRESLGLQGDQTSQSWRKSVLYVHWKDWCWHWSQYFGYLMGRANSLEKSLSWERLKAGERDDREQDCWMASLTQWTWVWGSSGRWQRTGKLGVLQSMESQRVRHD